MLCCTAVWGQRKTLTAAEAETFRGQVETAVKSLKSLESDFIQTKQLSYVEKSVQSSGKLYFKAPDKIRWEYLTPTQVVEVYDLASVKKPGSTAGLLAAAISGDVFDETRFHSVYYRERGHYTAVLTPREKSLGRYVKQIELAFDDSTFLLHSIKITEPTQDFTRLDFEKQRKDVIIPDDKFTK